jgi:hypothetical protein
MHGYEVFGMGFATYKIYAPNDFSVGNHTLATDVYLNGQYVFSALTATFTVTNDPNDPACLP